MPPNAMRRAKLALAASTRVDDLGLALHYAAAARLALDEARVELGQLEALLRAREQELVGHGPRQGQQLAIGEPTR